VVNLHKKHLHHLEEKLVQTNKLLADLVWFSSNVTDAIEKKFQSMVWNHENVVKSAQHHQLAPGALPHDVLDGIIDHVTAVANKKNLVPFVTFASDLFQIEVSHLYTLATDKFTLILHIPMVTNSNLLDLYKFLPLPIHFNFASNISIMPDVGQTNLLAIGHSQSFQAISSTDLHACLHLGDTFFCKGRKVMETSLKRSCLGALYMANSNSIQNNCRFKIAEAGRRFLNCQKTLGQSTLWAPSAPKRSAPWPMLSRLCRYNQETPFESNPDATMGTRRPSTKQSKAPAPGKTESSMPPYYWISWINWINMRHQRPTGFSHHQRP